MLKNFLIKLVTDDGNVHRYCLVYGACLVVHAFYALLFYYVEVPVLMVFNIFSSIMYFTGMVMVRNNKLTVLWMLLLNLEIMVHGILCAHLLGYEYQFCLFTLAVIPITYFISYLDPAFTHPITMSSALAVINGVSVMIMLFRSIRYEPVYSDFPPDFVNITSQVNMIFTIMLLISFSMLFIGKISGDMRKLKEQNDALDFLANYDQLTGLRNRNHIRDIFTDYIKSEEPYCVILGDIDDFKHVNDTYGHNAGDEVLKMVSTVVKSNVGDNGVACRWGGEEILMLIKGDTAAGLKTNEKILRDIRENTVEFGNYHIHVTMTFGLCDYSDAMNIEKLISLADKRLYIGKKNGKNRIVAES